MSHTCSCGTHAEPTPAPTRITAEQILAEVSKRPGALAVLRRLGINHCCGAHLSLREAAAAAGVPLERILRALDETVSASA